MKTRLHLLALTRSPKAAESNFQIKLEGTTMIIDRIMLGARQAPWKAGDFEGESGGTSTTDTTGTDTGTGTGTGTTGTGGTGF